MPMPSIHGGLALNQDALKSASVIGRMGMKEPSQGEQGADAPRAGGTKMEEDSHHSHTTRQRRQNKPLESVLLFSLHVKFQQI